MKGEDGSYTVKASTAFDTEHGMTVRMADGTVLTITVTDDGAVVTAKKGDNLQSVIDSASNGQTIQLGDNFTGSITIAAGKTITIDLNGKTLTNSDKQHTIINNGNLTIIDSVGGGRVDNISHARAALLNNGTATLNGGTFDRSQEAGTLSPYGNGGNSYYTIDNQGSLTVNSGTTVTTASGKTGVGGFSSLVRNGGNNTDATLTINGGSFSGGLNTIKNDERSTLTISGGEMTNTSQAVILNWNNAEITGGTLVSNNKYGIIMNAKYSENAVGHLVIKGGTFNAGSSNTIISKFGGGYDSDDILISGGKFSVKPDAKFIADGLVASADGSMYTVGKPAPAADPVPAQPSAKTEDKQDDKLVEAKNDDKEIPADVKVEGSVVKITVTDEKGTAAKADEVTIKSVAALEELGVTEASIQFNENVVVELDVASIKAEGASSITVKFEDDSVQIICDGVVIFEADLSEFTASGEKLTIKFVDGVLKVFDSNGTLLKEFTNK